jgi:HPt (histidine-containing phosphotransfer) domain-containing protein
MLLRTLDGLISTTEDRRVLSVLPAELAEVEPLSSTREEDPSLRQILPQFVTRMSRFVEHIARAIPDGELATATKTARSLGATADNCGFEPLAEAANALAEACNRPESDGREIGKRLDALEKVAKRIQAAYPQFD